MTDVLTNHQWDDKYKAADKKKKENNNSNGGRNTSDSNQDGKSLAQTVTPPIEKNKDYITCFCCREKGHYSSKCEKKDEIHKEKWFIKERRNRTTRNWAGAAPRY